jgi:DNA-binding Xre family transcriptional regulator
MSGKTVSYRWHLRRLMAEAGMFSTTDLGPLLAERGITLSKEQVWRLVTGVPERLSLATLTALCDILGCQPGDLIEVVRSSRARSPQASEGTDPGPRPVPVRARIGRDTGRQ